MKDCLVIISFYAYTRRFQTIKVTYVGEWINGIYICKNFYIGVVELFVVYINEIKVKAGNKQH